MASIRDVQDAIHTWANSVFPNRTPYQQICKLVLEEIPELLRDYHDGSIDPGEFADCAILLFDIATQKGIDIEKAILDKMAINKNRTWEVNKTTGQMHHVKTVVDLSWMKEDDEWAGWSEPCAICGPYALKHDGGPTFHIRMGGT
jgi:Protein of unknown function (DUF550)